MEANLIKFEELAKQKSKDFTKPPYRVPSSALDSNFKKLTPIDQKGNGRAYSVNYTKDGWEILPARQFVVCVNGTAQQYLFFAKPA